ncbi:hypothetical protein LZ30DRAFT_738990 [Colletotrichum cereale]|nr:hypothetical protein LZ30DRAFT_738990 [Colletotrichum cereale]
MWSASDDLTRALIQIPVLLYTIEQVFMAQILVYVFKWYLRRAAKAEAGAAEDEEGGGSASGGVGSGAGTPAGGDGEDELKGREPGGVGHVVPVKAASQTQQLPSA